MGTEYGYDVQGKATINIRLEYTASTTDWHSLTPQPFPAPIVQLRVNFSAQAPQAVVALQNGAVYYATVAGTTPNWTQLVNADGGWSTEGCGAATQLRVQWRLPSEVGMPSLVVGFANSMVQFWSGLPGCNWQTVGDAGQWGSPVTAMRVEFNAQFGGAPQVCGSSTGGEAGRGGGGKEREALPRTKYFLRFTDAMWLRLVPQAWGASEEDISPEWAAQERIGCSAAPSEVWTECKRCM